MTRDLTLQCSRVPSDELYIDPFEGGLLVQVSQDGGWSQVVLTYADALSLAEHILMYVPREQSNEH
ncbi:hypothetical protein D9M71_559890 [compost metagenome]